MPEIYCWGSAAKLIDKQNNQYTTNIIPQQSKIRAISCGQSHYFVLTQDNYIRGYGLNDKGQLGVNDDQSDKYFSNVKPSILNCQIIKQISCGWNHTMILDTKGQVFTCGEGYNGAIGYNRQKDSYNFKKVQIKQGILTKYAFINYISAGRDHSLALSDTKVYGWGSSKDHQLGLLKQKIYYQPQQLYIFHSSFCYAGQKCSFFCTKQGIYAVGNNQGGKLGIGHDKKIKIPKKININQNIIRIQDGGNYILFETQYHQYYICGNGVLGQFIYPTKINKFKQYTNVFIGKNFGIIKDTNFEVQTWNFETQPTPHRKKLLSSLKITQFAVGPKFLIGYSNTPNHLKMNRYGMVKSSIYQDETNNLNQKRKQSDDLDFLKIPNNQKNNTLQISQYCFANQQPTSSIRNPEIHTQINESLERSNYNDNYQVQTPIFLRSEYINKNHQNNDEQINLSDQLPDKVFFCQQIPQQIYKNQNQFYPYERYGHKDSCQVVKDYQYNGKIKMLEQQNKKKDEQLKAMRKQFADLLEIIESDRVLRKVVQMKNSQYFNKKQQSYKISANNSQKTDRFTQYSTSLKKILSDNYCINQ